jgi:2,3-bisphosphoglycerate-independent phosphoglycerate mutase
MKKVILIVRDGWGYSEKESGNAVRLARTPNHDYYLETYPWTILKCTGNAIGVPEGTQGGSEPGHLTMGAGRIVWQSLAEINRRIADGGFYSNEVLLDAVRNVKAGEGRLHLMGLHSDQGIHGTTQHLYALLELARRNDLDDVYIHCFLDGRDVPERSAKLFLEETMTQIKEKRVGRIASIVGRYYPMDRDTNWGRIQTAYDLLTLGEGRRETDVFQAIERSYQGNDLSDYYLEPIVMTEEDGGPIAVFEDGDSVVFWNFRSDRARQLTYALTKPEFEQFHRCVFPFVHFTCMSVYDRHIGLPVAFPQQEVENNLGQVLSDHGLKQLRIAETEKYAHVTFFFNSQVEDPNPGEDRILVPSPKVPNYEEKPEMSAPEITERLVPEIRKGVYDFILLNYANGDLVGHSANIPAGIKASEAVDRCVGSVVDTSLEEGYVVLVTGDHGNIESMFYPDGSPNPSHGLNPVPFILISNESELRSVNLRDDLGLSSVAPTIIELMGLRKPSEMTGETIITR